MRVAGTVVLLIVASALTSHHAGAICGRAPDVFFVPYGDRTAPLNTHVRLTMPADWETHTIDCLGRYDEEIAPGTCRATKLDLVLRTAAVTGRPARDLVVSRRSWKSGEVASVELVPQELLRPRTRYEVWHLDSGGAVRPRVLATFETSDAEDRVAPSWSGITSARRFTVRVECETDGIQLTAAPATDDATPAAQIRYGVWIADDRGRLDYDAPPHAYAIATPALRKQGDAPQISIPLGLGDPPDFTLPSGKKSLKLGVKAVDLAGNASPPSETVVKL